MNVNIKFRYIVLPLICYSIVSLLIAPLLMPMSYDWVKHTTSESAAQGIEGAWLARSGFVSYGIAVLLMAAGKQPWPGLTRGIHICFGLAMIGNAVFSCRPWLEDIPYSMIEDTLHSWMSALVGTAFTLGVLFGYMHRVRTDCKAKYFDLVAVITSVTVTLLMFGAGEEFAGVIQRVMFAVSYVWYINELFVHRAGSGVSATTIQRGH